MPATPNHGSTDNVRAPEPATTPAAQFLEKIKDHCFDPAHDYFGRTHVMAGPSPLLNELRPDGPSRARTAVENLLPAGIARRSKSRRAQSPHMERSTSSMADSFVDYWGVCARNPDPEGALTPAIQEDGLMPISNWAHLNYMKSQRNTLRTELKTQQIAGAEAKRSVASLRRLAFRMAVNISAKERQIAMSARNLMKSRASNYMDGRDAEKRVEALKRALRVEEGRNKEILEALERASMLTLQYANPADAQLRRPRNPLSPPPSPTTRLSTLSVTTGSDPRTPPRSTSSSWHATDWELTPGMESPSEVRTSDSRLIRAKRESDQALSACRRRINELQAECLKSKEDGKTLEAAKRNLEKDMDDHRSRMATLEQARATVEETLESTKLQLELSTGLEEGLKQKLRMKNKEIASLGMSSEARQDAFTAMEKERALLADQLEGRNTQLAKLETDTITLREKLKTLEDQLTAAQHSETSLRHHLEEKEGASLELKKRVDRGSKYEQILQKKIAEYEEEILGNVKKIEVGEGLVASLREQMKLSETNKRNAEDALAILRTEITNLEGSRTGEIVERDRLAEKLSSIQTAKNQLEEDLRITGKTLEQETSEKAQVQSDLQALQFSHNALATKLQAAHSHIHGLEQTDAERQAEFELLQDEKSAIEADLKDARQTLFTLREAERMSMSRLRELERSVKSLKQALHKSREREGVLESELTHARMAHAAAQQSREEESQKQVKQHRELQLSVTSLHASLEASEKLKTSLQEELQQLSTSNRSLEEELAQTLRVNTGLQDELDTARTTLEHNSSERENVAAKIAKLEADLTSRQQSQTSLEARLRVVHDESSALKSRVSELELTLSKAEENYLTNQQETEASKAEIEELRHRLSKSQESGEEVDHKLADAAATRADLETQLHNARSRLSELELVAGNVQLELSTERGSKTELEDLLRASQNTHEELKNSAQSSQLRLENVQTEVKAIKSKLAATEDEFERSRHSRAEVETKLEEVSRSHAGLEEELSVARQNHANLNGELSTLRQSKTDVEERLQAITSSRAGLQQNLATTRTQLRDFESRHATLTSMITTANQELAAVRDRQKGAEGHSESLSADLLSARSRLQELEAEKANLVEEALKTKDDISGLRDSNDKTEQQLAAATKRRTELENDLREARMRLEAAESESVATKSRFLEANKDVDRLNEANSKLAAKEKDLQTRLDSAEHDLQTVQDTNKRLETFLQRVEDDMARAETEFEESEKRLEEFVEESQSKLDVARSTKLKYKRRLSERNDEIETLLAENSNLHSQIGERTQELTTATKGREEMVEELTAKEKFVNELRSSSDQRMKSLNLAYNELRSKYEERLRRERDAAAEKISSDDKGRSSASSAALEQEVQALREDKKAFERLVATLQEKIRHLETLEQRQEPTEISSKARSGMAELDSIPSRPTTQQTGSSTPSSSISHPSVRDERPTTRASTASRQADLDTWASEAERIRMRRNEQAIQLRDNKKARSDLRKGLKETKTQLHQLERQSKSVRHRTLLRKNRPSTPFLTTTDRDQPTTPSRPNTSYTPFTPDGGTARSRHTIHFSPSMLDSTDRPNTSTPLSMAGRWSTLHRPKSSHRPATSGGLEDGAGVRPMTRAGEVGTGEAKEKRRWSTSLKKLFR